MIIILSYHHYVVI